MISIVMATGRFNPITCGHETIIDTVVESAKQKNAKPVIFIIDGEKTGKDKKKNPLSSELRLKILKKMYPKVYIDIVSNPLEALDVLEVLNMNPIIWYTGSDRVASYEKLLEYIDIKCRVLEVNRNIGKTAGVSASLAKKAAKNNDLEVFKSLMPKKLDDKDIINIFNNIRIQMEK